MDEKKKEGEVVQGKKSRGLSIAALVLGIIAIIFSFIPIINFISYILGLLALIFGVIEVIKSKSKGMAIAGIILAILSFYFASTMNKVLVDSVDEAINTTEKELNKISGDATDEVLEKELDVKLGNFTVIPESYGFTDTEMIVTVKNISDKKLSASIHIEAVNSNGDRIDEAYVIVNNLGAGQTTTEKVFTYVSSDKLDLMKTATFKIVEASVY